MCGEVNVKYCYSGLSGEAANGHLLTIEQITTFKDTEILATAKRKKDAINTETTRTQWSTTKQVTGS